MRRFLTSCAFFLFLYGLLTVRCQAQAQSGEGGALHLPGEGVSSAAGDSLALRRGYADAVKMYHASMAPESGLYRGSQYVDYAFSIKEGHPFFGDDHFRKGSVFYDGVLYENLPLIYDLAKGLVVLNDPFNIYKLYLVNERIGYFTIEGHLFIPQRDSLNPSAPTRGFYELLYGSYSGEWREAGGTVPVSLLKKEKKQVMEDLSPSEGIRRYVVQSISYYLRIGATYYPVNNKQSLSHALKGRARDARKFMRANGLSIRKDKENTLIKVAAWYESHHS